MKLKSLTGIALAAAIGSNANNLRTSSWVRSCKQRSSERRLQQGERVVDTGCGTGASSIALAERVGPSGQVLGLDVSAPIAGARCRAAAAGRPGQIRTRRRDDLSVRNGRFRSPFSRFGVMFFAARAFANLPTALKPSGRLVFACWHKFDENPWLQVPLCAALEHVPPLPIRWRSRYARFGIAKPQLEPSVTSTLFSWPSLRAERVGGSDEAI